MSLGYALASFLLMTLSAAAGVGGSGSPQRTTISLNGNWKFSPSDDASYKDMAFDDHRWAKIKVPGNWREQGYDHSGYAWYRLHFTPPDVPGRKFRYLRFGRIMDEGEVWFNGTKLTNPQLGNILKDKQYGSYWGNDGAKQFGVENYVHLWSFQWPFALNVSGLIQEGQENVIAVRVYDDPRTSFWVFGHHPDDTCFGRAGLMGDVELVATQEAHIEEFSFHGPTAIKDGKGTFTFRVRACGAERVRLTVTDAGGRYVFSQDKRVLDNVTEFSYSLEPSFSQYKASAELLKSQHQVTDSQSLTFYGICYEVRGTRIYVNGEEFLVKGLNGFPGHELGGSKTTRWDWLEEDCKLAKEIGANAFRGMNYHPQMLEAGYRYGIFFIPIISDSCGDIFKTFLHTGPDDDQSVRDAEVSVLAQRESPMVLCWTLANEVGPDESLPKYLEARQKIVKALDPYHRPTLYSNHAAQAFTGVVDIVGSNDPAGSPDLNWRSKWSDKKFEKPILVTEWALTDYAPYTKEFSRYEDTWYRMIVNPSRPYIGACQFPGLSAWKEYGGLRSGREGNQEFLARLAWLFRDMDFGYGPAGDGKSTELRLVNRRNYTLRDLRISLARPGEGATELTVKEIAPRSAVYLTTLTRWGKVAMKVGYETHHGLPCICNMEEEIGPDSAKQAGDRLKGIMERIRTLDEMEDTAQVRTIGENLIENGDFEAELTPDKRVSGWNLSGGRHHLSTEEKRSGRESMELVGDGTHFTWAEPGTVRGEDESSYLRIKPMTAYVVRFWHKVKANEPLTVNIFTNKRSLTGESWSVRLVSREWRQYSLKFVTQSDENLVGIHLCPYYANKDGRIWVDDVSLYECE